MSVSATDITPSSYPADDHTQFITEIPEFNFLL